MALEGKAVKPNEKAPTTQGKLVSLRLFEICPPRFTYL
jgi:hypothetical protein